VSRRKWWQFWKLKRFFGISAQPGTHLAETETRETPTFKTSKDVIAVLREFFYSHYDKNAKFITRVDRLHTFGQGQPRQVAAIALELAHQPGLVFWIMLEPNSCSVMLLHGPPSPDYDAYLLGLSHVAGEKIPAHRDALLECLNGFIDKGVLIKDDNRLRYSGQAAP